MSAPVAERVTVARDARGYVVEPLDPGELPGQRNFHLVVCEPGAVRANHFHRERTEILVVCGPALVRWREGDVLRDFDVPPGEAWRFTFPPGTPHAVRNTGSEPGILLSFGSHPLDPASPDVIREELIAP